MVAEKLLYVEEFFNPETRHCKFWFSARLVGGDLTTAHPEAASEPIVEAEWHTEERIRSLHVFPLVLHGQYWSDRRAGFASLQYLGQREVEFW